MNKNNLKKRVQKFWEEAACGERLYLKQLDKYGFEEQAAIRYGLEPFIKPFARFDSWAGRKVLEIGLGLGADHQKFAEGGLISRE